MDDKDEINLNGFKDWYNKLIDHSSGTTQFDLFYDDKTSLNGHAATISTAASGNTWPYPYVVTTGSGTGNISPGLTFSDSWRLPEQSLHVRGDAEFEGDIKLKGRSLSETLNKIEERLAILHPNEKLEEKWEELKKLGDMYRALEKDIIEKEKIWETLKK